MPRTARLRRRKDFDEVFKRGRRVGGRHFACHFLAESTEAEGALGVAVSRKVGKAVTRNRVKRHIREFYRSHRHLLAQGLRLVVVARPGAGEMTSAAVHEELLGLLKRGKLLDA